MTAATEEERCAAELRAALGIAVGFANRLEKLGWHVDPSLTRPKGNDFDFEVRITKRITL